MYALILSPPFGIQGGRLQARTVPVATPNYIYICVCVCVTLTLSPPSGIQGGRLQARTVPVATPSWSPPAKKGYGEANSEGKGMARDAGGCSSSHDAGGRGDAGRGDTGRGDAGRGNAGERGGSPAAPRLSKKAEEKLVKSAQKEANKERRREMSAKG